MMLAVQRPRAILLDLDGTLVDASIPIVDGVRALAREHGLRVPSPAWTRGRIGFPPEETWHLLGAPDPSAMALLFREHCAPGLARRTRVMDGARETLAALVAGGWRLGLATTRATASARETLQVTGLIESIEFIGGGDAVTRHKPAPDVLLLVLQQLGCTPGTALMVGDTTADVQAAHAAGLPCWAVLGGTHDEKTLREAGADRILCEGIAQLPAELGTRSPRSGARDR
jgi:phosphoglycolate phosphatase